MKVKALKNFGSLLAVFVSLQLVAVEYVFGSLKGFVSPEVAKNHSPGDMVQLLGCSIIVIILLLGVSVSCYLNSIGNQKSSWQNFE